MPRSESGKEKQLEIFQIELKDHIYRISSFQIPNYLIFNAKIKNIFRNFPKNPPNHVIGLSQYFQIVLISPYLVHIYRPQIKCVKNICVME